MDKKTLSKVCLVCVLTMAAGSAYAANITGTTVLHSSSGTFGCSSNVTITIVAIPQSYAAVSQHLNGDRIYWGSNSDPRLYFTNKTTGSTTTVTVTATMTAISGYSSM